MTVLGIITSPHSSRYSDFIALVHRVNVARIARNFSYTLTFEDFTVHFKTMEYIPVVPGSTIHFRYINDGDNTFISIMEEYPSIPCELKHAARKSKTKTYMEV